MSLGVCSSNVEFVSHLNCRWPPLVLSGWRILRLMLGNVRGLLDLCIPHRLTDCNKPAEHQFMLAISSQHRRNGSLGNAVLAGTCVGKLVRQVVDKGCLWLRTSINNVLEMVRMHVADEELVPLVEKVVDLAPQVLV